MNINYEYYRTFYYVAKHRNLTRAADEMLSNQPNVTRTIKKLEEALGCTLMIRSNRGIALTQEGERLYRHVRIAVEQLQEAEETLSNRLSSQQGALTVGVTEVALRCLLLSVLNTYHRQCPNVLLRIANQSTPEAIAALRSGASDLAVVTMPFPVPELRGLALRQLQVITTLAAAGSDYACLSGVSVSPEMLSGYPLVSLETQTQTYQVYAEWFSRQGLRFQPEIEAATADQILPMVSQNLGIGFVPAQFLQGRECPEDVFPLDMTVPLPAFCVCYVRRIDHPLSPAARIMERLLLNHADEGDI